MNIRTNIIAALALSLGFAATPVFAQTLSADRGAAHGTYGTRTNAHSAGDGYYNGIIANEFAHSNDDASAAGGNAEQPERLVPQVGQE